MRITKTDSVVCHYDSLVDENNDPAHDPKPLKQHMDKWDGTTFIDALDISPEKSVLEIGVGTGRLALRVCDFCNKFTGIDISPKTIQKAKENLKTYKNVTLIYDDFLNYNFAEKFDVIYSSLTFLHIENKEAAIQKVSTLLNLGGRFVLSIDKNQEKFIDHGNRKIKIFPDNPENISSLLEKANFKIISKLETEFAFIFVAVTE